MVIDDDIFFTPGQVRKFFMALLQNPSVPYGPRGENFVVKNGKVLSCKIIGRKNGEVDAIIWAYSFTREHLTEYFSLLEHMKVSSEDVRFSDDVVISFSGRGKPRCVDLGPLLCCPSSRDKDIAVYRQDGFHKNRYRVYLQCMNAAAERTKIPT
jgi:hypothetical protein